MMQSTGALMNSSPGHIKNESWLLISEGDTPYIISAELKRIGIDIVCIITGGTHAHIGAVSLAEPAVSLHPVTGQKIEKGSEPIVRILIGEGHKDALPAEMYAKALCRHFNVNVVCTAGIHVDGATQEEIDIMMKNVKRLLEKLLEAEI